MSIQDQYLALVDDNKILKDGVQLDVVRHFDYLKNEIEQKQVIANTQKKEQAQKNALAQFFYDPFSQLKKKWSKKDSQKLPLEEGVYGIYLWGAVGRGKTFLMDLFFDALKVPKMRLHYYAFMNRVHQEIKANPEEQDPLFKVAKRLANDYRVIFLDEFFVSDITDAMILHRLILALFQQKVYLVTTSNVVPSELFKGGLQRERFIPAIQLIQDKMQVLSLEVDKDYRLRNLSQADLWINEPNLELGRQALMSVFLEYANDAKQNTLDSTSKVQMDVNIEVNGRMLFALAKSDHAIVLDFFDLCGQATGANDYLVLAKRYDVVFLNNVPMFDEYLENEARRFISLIDAFYDQKCKLVVSSDTEIVALYQGERLRFEFERTKSRLIEMQSNEYWTMKKEEALL